MTNDALVAAASPLRDGKRIKHPGDGGGYGDMVPDQAIELHAIHHAVKGDYAEAVFCLAVLDLRRREAEQRGKQAYPRAEEGV